jgi:DNA-binding CsgD family transcriptional regulator
MVVSPVLVGRERERAELAAARTAAADGPVVVLVAGDAGMGKTRLVRDFTDGLVDALVLVGGCTDLGADGPPFGAFVTALRRLVRAIPEVAARLPAGGRRGLARLLPELGEDESDPDRELGRARLFEEVLLLLETAAKDRFLVLVLDDLHWADRSTGELLDFLARNLSQPGVLLVGTYRPDEVARPLLSRVDGVRRIDLVGLSKAAVREQLGALLDGPPDEPMVDRIFRRSGGNPLFVEALLDEPGRPAASLRELLLAGVDRLPAAGRRILHAAAVAGSPVSHDLLAAAVQLSELDFEEALRPVVERRQLEVVEDGYAFRRDLFREAIYDGLLPGERVRLHARCAAAISADPRLVAGDRVYGELAVHWHAAAEPGRAAMAAWRAAESARRAYAYAEQHRMLDRVLRLWDHLPAEIGVDRLTVQEMTVQACLDAGELEAGIAITTAALAEAHNVARTALILTTRAAMRDRLGQDSLPDLAEAVKLLPATSEDGRPLAAMATALRNKRRLSDARTAAEQALAIGERTGDRRVSAEALITLAALAASDADLPAASTLFGAAGEAAREAGDHDTQLLVAVTESDTLEAAGEHVRAAAVARQGIALAAELGLARTRGTLLAPNLAESYLSMGRWTEVAEVVRPALALAPPPLYRAYLQIIQATADVRTGALTAAGTAAQQARATMRGQNRGDESCLEPDLLDYRLAAAAGNFGAAAAIVDHDLADHDLPLSPRYGWPLLLAAAQLAPQLAAMPRYVRQGQHDGRREELAGWGRKLPVTGRLQRAYQLTFEAELGEVDAWPEAVAAWRALDQPYALAQALLWSARAALSERDRDSAGVRLGEAAAIAADLGAGPLSAEIEQVAKRSRLVVSQGQQESPSGLTPRELEVLRLVADGLSNRQIAEQLFISAKTAGVHVSNILAKLMLTTRLEAAAWAHRTRLFDTP